MDEKKKISGEEFIAAVCEKVRFKPAREKIAEELRAHIEDRAAMLMEHGVAPENAAARAAASMGDPAEIGAALDREHSSFWGWTAELAGAFIGLAAIALAVCLAESWLLYDSRGEVIDMGLFWFRDQSFAGETLCREPLLTWCETEEFWVLLTGLEITAMQGGQGAVQIDRVFFYKDPFRDTSWTETGLTLTLRAGEEMLPVYLNQEILADLLAAPPDTLTLEIVTDLGERRTVEVPVDWRAGP